MNRLTSLGAAARLFQVIMESAVVTIFISRSTLFVLMLAVVLVGMIVGSDTVFLSRTVAAQGGTRGAIALPNQPLQDSVWVRNSSFNCSSCSPPAPPNPPAPPQTPVALQEPMDRYINNLSTMRAHNESLIEYRSDSQSEPPPSCWPVGSRMWVEKHELYLGHRDTQHYVALRQKTRLGTGLGARYVLHSVGVVYFTTRHGSKTGYTFYASTDGVVVTKNQLNGLSDQYLRLGIRLSKLSADRVCGTVSASPCPGGANWGWNVEMVHSKFLPDDDPNSFSIALNVTGCGPNFPQVVEIAEGYYYLGPQAPLQTKRDHAHFEFLKNAYLTYDCHAYQHQYWDPNVESPGILSQGAKQFKPEGCAWHACRGDVPGTPCCDECEVRLLGEGDGHATGLVNPHLFPVSTDIPLKWDISFRGTSPNHDRWVHEAEVAATAWNSATRNGGRGPLLERCDGCTDVDIQIRIYTRVRFFQRDMKTDTITSTFGYALHQDRLRYMPLPGTSRGIWLPEIAGGCPWVNKTRAILVGLVDNPTENVVVWQWGHGGITDVQNEQLLRSPALRGMTHELGHALGLDEANLVMPSGSCPTMDHTDQYIMCQVSTRSHGGNFLTYAVDEPSEMEISLVWCAINLILVP